MTQDASLTSPCPLQAYHARAVHAPPLELFPTFPLGNPMANDQARAIADKNARGFICKKDRAKHYGAGGN